MTKQDRQLRDRAHQVMQLTRDYFQAGKALSEVTPDMDRLPAAEALRKAAEALQAVAPDAYWAAYESAIQYELHRVG